ncbi:MAG: tetratricopeptide repeat protein [Methanotrichaceae archaeon]
MKSLKDILSRGYSYNAPTTDDPSNPKTWYNKGVDVMSQGDFLQAIKYFDKAIELDPKDVKSWNNKGICLLSISRFDDAIACIDKTIEIDPQHAFYWYNRGVCMDRLGHVDEAIQSFDKAIELYPKYAEAWFNKAVALESKGGEKKAAIDAWRSYIRISAKDRGQKEWIPKAQERLAKLEEE